MGFGWVLAGLYVTCIVGFLAMALMDIHFANINRQIVARGKELLEQNKRVLDEVNEMWERSVKLNDDSLRALREIRQRQGRGEEWKDGGK